MQLAVIRVATGLVEPVRPRAARIESGRVKTAVARGNRMRFLVVVHEAHALPGRYRHGRGFVGEAADCHRRG